MVKAKNENRYNKIGIPHDLVQLELVREQKTSRIHSFVSILKFDTHFIEKQI